MNPLRRLLDRLKHQKVVFQNYAWDARRFLRHSSTTNPDMSPTATQARLTKEYHRIEKGMALPETRPGFGAAALSNTRTLVQRLERQNNAGLETQGARGTLARYADFHGADLPADVAWTADFTTGDTSALPGGTRVLTRAELDAARAMDFDAFARSRYSVRQFTGAPVDPAEITRAVSTALKTPRVCNRESRRVHVAYSEPARTRMLGHQNGNRGFGHLAGAVILVTADVRHFTDLGERNQPWIDGGLFAMSLAYALHGQGLGACMLNWSATWWRDRDLRADLNIPDHEVIITMMAVGHMPDQVTVAASPPPDVTDILHEIR